MMVIQLPGADSRQQLFIVFLGKFFLFPLEIMLEKRITSIGLGRKRNLLRDYQLLAESQGFYQKNFAKLWLQPWEGMRLTCVLFCILFFALCT